MSEVVAFIVVISLALLCLIAPTYSTGFDHGTENGIAIMQRKAVAVGAARWVVISETGETQFEWKGTP